ncbi:MAG: FAD-binding oxidoreductase [Anaerolineae bacterium]|uniref:NAD(P)/FAD-dependent oxidoreductase n=1 Tax=Promineifilum sp. TaxID=2664178 RepID=UPI001D798EAD|nr:FAD-binding oxidoreductase [Anaerolineales bacterium]MCB8935571.1 FAD-binding oxidoreductase [Promineifilum sp.]MCO5180632.1 FAD-binding oxidoreductase [Promineifilum sp.]MCW5847641.1 FAD-binding oxidoreductase [Anaerolineae bacterium]
MSILPPSASVVVVGGGVMGASTAYHLALRGVRDVVLLESQPFFGQGATGKCAGGIRYQFSTAINVRLSQLSLPMLARFEAETGQPIDLRYDGYMLLATTEDNVAEFRRNVALQHSLGVPTEWLSGDEVRRRVPQLAAGDVLAATFHAGDGLADPNGVVAGYISAGRRLGVRAFNDAPVTDIEVERGRAVAVVTPLGRVACETVVNAAGPWAALIGDMAGVSLPITPVRRQMLTTTPLPDLAPDFPFVIDFARSLYFHREGEGLLTGMSNPHQTPGFDESVDAEWELTHLEAAVERLPLLAHAGLLGHWAGLYEVTPDAHPIIGRMPELENFVVVAGFSGHGFMHGPIAGLLVSEIILDGGAHTLDITELGYERFDRGQHHREYNVI